MKPYQTGDYTKLLEAEYEAARKRGCSQSTATLLAEGRLYELVKAHVLEELDGEAALRT